MITEPINIHPSGQVVLPRAVRALLKTSQIAFEIVGDTITIKQLPSAKGALASYYKKINDADQARDQAWIDSCHER